AIVVASCEHPRPRPAPDHLRPDVVPRSSLLADQGQRLGLVVAAELLQRAGEERRDRRKVRTLADASQRVVSDTQLALRQAWLAKDQLGPTTVDPDGPEQDVQADVFEPRLRAFVESPRLVGTAAHRLEHGRTRVRVRRDHDVVARALPRPVATLDRLLDR